MMSRILLTFTLLLAVGRSEASDTISIQPQRLSRLETPFFRYGRGDITYVNLVDIVQQNRLIAIEILRKAMRVCPHSDYAATEQALRTARIHVQHKKEEILECRRSPLDPPGAYTFAFHSGGEITLCAWPNGLLGEKYEFLPQGLIHEAAHAAGFKSECRALKIEYSAYRDAGLPAYSNYEAQCGLDRTVRLCP